MMESLATAQLIKELKLMFEEFPDLRTGSNRRYEIADAGLGAFSVFFTQCASFLEYQEEMKRLKKFGIEHTTIQFECAACGQGKSVAAAL